MELRSHASKSIALIAAVLLSASQAPTASAAAGDGVLSILVMGDSYSAGNGAGPRTYDTQHNPACWRSSQNYGRQFASIVGAAQPQLSTRVQTVACSGAETSAFTQTTGGRPPQVKAIDRSYDLIFLTIGGNDLHFKGIVGSCLVSWSRSGGGCARRLGEAEAKLADGTLTTGLRAVLTAVQGRADPDATIVLLGYPYLEADPDFTLRSAPGLQVGKRLRKLQDSGDAIEQRVVKGVNKGHRPKVVFVRTKKVFEGPPNHELYAGVRNRNANRWLTHPRDTRQPLFWYHPNPIGWRQEAQLLAGDRRIPKQP